MFLWTRPWTLQAVVALLTSDKPTPRFLVPLEEWLVDLLLLLPLMILVGQVYIRLAASLKLPKPIQAMLFNKPALWTSLLQGLFADVLFHLLLKSVVGGSPPVTPTTGGWKDPWGSWNEPFILFMVRLMISVLGLTLGEAFFPLVLTGGIACGKSTISKLLQDQANFYMIDTDRIGHLILLPPWHADLHPPGALVTPRDSVYVRILETFHDTSNENDTPETSTKKDPHILPGVNDKHLLLDSDKNIDRAKLGARIFAHPDERRKLNAITHPRIFYCLLVHMTKALLWYKYPRGDQKEFVCAEIPLLFETKSLVMRHIFGLVMVVACTETQQYQRLRQRNPELTKEACQQRIDSQLPMTVKIQRADIVLWNDKEYSSTSSSGNTNSNKTDENKDGKDTTNDNAQDKRNKDLIQQVDKAVHVIRQRKGGVMETTLSRVLLFLSGSVVISASFKLVMGW